MDTLRERLQVRQDYDEIKRELEIMKVRMLYNLLGSFALRLYLSTLSLAEWTMKILVRNLAMDSVYHF